jgi:hypothetical protein
LRRAWGPPQPWWAQLLAPESRMGPVMVPRYKPLLRESRLLRSQSEVFSCELSPWCIVGYQPSNSIPCYVSFLWQEPRSSRMCSSRAGPLTFWTQVSPPHSCSQSAPSTWIVHFSTAGGLRLAWVSARHERGHEAPSVERPVVLAPSALRMGLSRSRIRRATGRSRVQRHASSRCRALRRPQIEAVLLLLGVLSAGHGFKEQGQGSWLECTR